MPLPLSETTHDYNYTLTDNKTIFKNSYWGNFCCDPSKKILKT